MTSPSKNWWCKNWPSHERLDPSSKKKPLPPITLAWRTSCCNCHVNWWVTTLPVKGLKVVAKCCLNWISFHDDLCCCVEYSNVENDLQYLSLKVIKLRSSIRILKSDVQIQMIESGLGCRFHDLHYFEVWIFFHTPWNHYLLEGIITELCGNHRLNVILFYFN